MVAFNGELELSATAALKTGDKFTVAKYKDVDIDFRFVCFVCD